MKPHITAWLLAGLFFLCGCGGSDRDKKSNKDLDRPMPESKPAEKK